MCTLHLMVSCDAGGIETLCKDYLFYSKNKNIVVCLFQGGCIAEEMKNLGIEVIELGCRKTSILKTLYKLITLCKEKNVRTVITHHASPISHIYMMLIKKKCINIKTVAYAHGNAEDMYNKNKGKGASFRKLILKKSLNSANLVIAISNSVSVSLQKEFDLQPEKVNVIYNGVDVEKFHSPICAMESDCIKLIYVGRLIKEKGVQNTLVALSYLDKSINWNFTIVGDGDYHKELKKLALELEIDKNVEFLGKRRDIQQLLTSADCFVHMPDWEEGFGITIVEAMAAGKICICANRGAINEIIVNNKNGFLINDTDDMIFELAEKIRDIYAKRGTSYLTMVKEAAIKSAELFSIKRYVDEVDNLIAD